MQERKRAKEEGTGQYGIYAMSERLRGSEGVQGEEMTDLNLFILS